MLDLTFHLEASHQTKESSGRKGHGIQSHPDFVEQVHRDWTRQAGLYCQVEAFLAIDVDRFVLFDQVKHAKIYNKIAGYL